MKGQTYVEILREIFEVANNKQLADALQTSASKISSWEKGEISKTILKNSLSAILAIERNHFRGDDLIDYAKKRYSKKSDAEIAALFNVTQPALTGWRKTGLTMRSVFDLVEKMKTAHATSVVTPVIEYYPISPGSYNSASDMELIEKKDTNYKPLMSELKTKHGVYAFFDSQGACVYVGKAKGQSLWREMNLALHRHRGAAQAIMRVSHIKIKRFVPEVERKRQIKPYQVPLNEIARYFSAYEVQEEFIDNFEAAIIRIFSNTLLNIKMEQFEHI